MASPKKTVVTFAVKIELPTGSNAHAMQAYIRNAITSHGSNSDPDDPHYSLAPESFTVALQKKEVTYA